MVDTYGRMYLVRLTVTWFWKGRIMKTWFWYFQSVIEACKMQDDLRSRGLLVELEWSTDRPWQPWVLTVKES